MRDIVSEIKARIDILTLVSEYVSLKKAGRYYKGLSPFKPEKTPSFMVSPDRGIAYCFSTNKGGDIFKFLMEVENVEFPEALKILAEKAGVELDEKEAFKSVGGSKSEKQVLLDMHDKVAQYYTDQLFASKEGEKVLAYLHGRGLLDETIKKFRLGFAPDSFDQTSLFLMKLNFNHKQILQAGLALSKDTSGNRIYDRFRGRLMFPVEDAMQRVVGFGGRALAKDQEPKYLNSPETAIYQKSSLLYGFCHSKASIREKKLALVVEGYMDMLAAWQNGVKNVAAVNGTAFTSRQLTMLKSFAETLILGFDMDSAGEEAAKRAFELAQEEDIAVQKLLLPSGKDIAEYCLSKDADLQAVLATSPGFADYLYDGIVAHYDKHSLASKKQVIDAFVQFVLKLKSSMERDAYIRKLAFDLEIDNQVVIDEINSQKHSKLHGAKKQAEIEENKQEGFSPQEKLLALLLEFPTVFFKTEITLSQDIFSEFVKTVYKEYCDIYNAEGNGNCDFSEVLARLDDDQQDRIKILSLYARKQYEEYPEDQIEKEILALSALIHDEHRKEQFKRLHRSLQEAESRQDKSQMEALLKVMSELKQQ